VPAFIAVLIAFDAARGVTIAELAAAFVVTTPGPELCAVKGSEQPSPATNPNTIQRRPPAQEAAIQRDKQQAASAKQ